MQPLYTLQGVSTPAWTNCIVRCAHSHSQEWPNTPIITAYLPWEFALAVPLAQQQ